MIGYFDKSVRQLVLIIPKMSWYIKAFKIEDESSKLISFQIDDEKLFEKYKANWSKIEALENIELIAWPIYD